MILLTILALGAGMIGRDDPTYACPVMGSTITTAAETFDYKGVRYFSCCAGCAAQFTADPDKYIKLSAEKSLTIGQSLYDPVSHARVNPKPSLPQEVYQGVRYVFQNDADKTKFDSDRDSFTKSPDMEVLKCPVLDTVVKEPGSSPGYFDQGGMRIYLCCDKCINPGNHNKETLALKAKPSAVKATVHIVSADDLKNEKELLHE